MSETQEERTFWRTIITVEVLSEDYYDPASLKQSAYDIVDGDCSGSWSITEREAVGPERMAELLQEQGSDASFFQIDEEQEGAS